MCVCAANMRCAPVVASAFLFLVFVHTHLVDGVLRLLLFWYSMFGGYF